jgi:predicted nucleic acid-binding protein
LIIDTTYLLPLSGIGVDTDLLRAAADNRISLDFDDVSISMISIFELQAKAAKLGIPARLAVEATETINTVFRIEPFYNPKIIRTSQSLLGTLKDYIDCLIVATAIVLQENLVTEDTKVLAVKKFIKETYRIDIFTFKELLGKKVL